MEIDLTEYELDILIFVVKNRLRNEAKRPRKLNPRGFDMQNYRVRNLADILEKLEASKISA